MTRDVEVPMGVVTVRAHDPLCQIARETWCVWPGDKCANCALIAKVREATQQRVVNEQATLIVKAYQQGRADALAEVVAYCASSHVDRCGCGAEAAHALTPAQEHHGALTGKAPRDESNDSGDE